MPEMKTPGPDHPIVLEAAPGRVQALYAGHVIADSANVLMLREASYPPVAYFPRDDVDMAFMGRTDRRTHCPYKGFASYYTLNMDGKLAENAVWSYEDPYPAMAAIHDRLAFYPNVVEIQLVREPAGPDVNASVLHTDAGDGTSQAQHWAPTVDEPTP
jgi:uncharacterized protein (DUF427 family)